MAKRYVDRGGILKGQDRTSRDSRIPYQYPRVLENFALPDGRARRRAGFGSVHEPVRTQALCKSTGVGYSKKLVESDYSKGTVAATPLSYGLIRWHDDFQLRTGRASTIEFNLRLGDKEELVRNPFSRIADYPGGAAWNNLLLREPGVFVYDQTILSNHHIFSTATVTKATGAIVAGTTYDLGAAYLTATQFDVFPLTALAIGYTETKIFAIIGLMEVSGGTVGTYITPTTLSYSFPSGSYTVGDIHNVAVVYDTTGGLGAGRVFLYIDSVLRDTLILPLAPYGFVGQFDLVNGLTYATGMPRDIVLLNECTVRGSYSSACKIRDDMHGHQTFFHDFSNTPNTGINPWACSPPRGTAMWDLRIWLEARASGDLILWQKKRILASDTNANLKGNWHLNDGGPVCTNKVTGLTKRYCTIHHGYPGYIEATGMLNGIGLKLGEGQHIIKSTAQNDAQFSGLCAKLHTTFDRAVSATAWKEHRDQHAFTVQIQIMVPDAFQFELNDKSADPLTMRDLALTETRRFINVSRRYQMMDGAADTAVTGRAFIGHPTDGVAPYDTRQSIRAFDQTLWSIEGTQRADVAGATNEPERRRIPLARGMLTPQGRVVFELWKSSRAGTVPQYFRLRGATTLTIGSVYTLTFVHKVNYVYTAAGTEVLDADGWKMELWLQNVTAGTAAVLDSTHTVAAASPFLTTPVEHELNYDISVGASYVNDGWDQSIQLPTNNASGATSYVAGAGTPRGNWGPWPVQQRFMSPYQDQPGNFVLGMFRIWTIALPEGSIKDFGNSAILHKDRTADLIVNLEFEEVSGVEVPNKSRYPDSFRLGYKGWGMPQGYRDQTWLTTSFTVYLKKELFHGTWAYEDCLGYMKIDSAAYDARQQYTQVTGISAVKSSYAQQHGILSVYNDAPAFDESLSNVYDPLFVTGHGLMSEFFPSTEWRGTVVGNRTILTGPGALPKVFDGKTLTTAGFKRWTGGTLQLYKSSATGGLTALLWYGVVVVYYSEDRGIYHVSPVATCRLDTGNALEVFNVPQHPDPRVSIVDIYRTLGQSTQSLALSAPLYKSRVVSPSPFVSPNAYAESYVLSEPDSSLTGVILDRNVTEFPMCSFSAALNDRLYLAGDPLNPDLVYYTDSGNPERIDSFANSVRLPEGSGDAVTGLISAFGSIFVFKPNAIWRIDNPNGNNYQLNRLVSVGAVSNKSIQQITNPDTGRTVLFFWSLHGPYIFDGSTIEYVGGPLEESSFGGTTAAEYNWLNPTSVVVGHNASAREIICFYKPRRTIGGVTTELDRNGEAVVFNYRMKAWYKYTGVICNNALSTVLTGSPSSVAGETGIFQTANYQLMLGGDNGKLYKWGTALNDGLPTGLVVAQSYPITAINSAGSYRIATLPFTHELQGCWITIVNHLTGDWITAPIQTTDTATTSVVVQTDWLLDSSFTPAVNNLVYLCQAPAKVEYPWDELDVPFLDKDVVRLVTWHDTAFRYRVRNNYVALTVFNWIALADGNSQRKKTELKKKVEAIKLELSSLELSSSLDAYAYEVLHEQGANTAQQ